MQLHGTARHCRLLCQQSFRALKSCATLAPSPPHSRRVMPGHAAYATGGLRQYQTESRRVQLGCSMSARGRDPGPILNARTEFGTIVTAAFTLRPTLSAPPFWRALLFSRAFR
eukprot:scaffold35841_cov46-Phaeocystis_antarctica.AAC.7